MQLISILACSTTVAAFVGPTPAAAPSALKAAPVTEWAGATAPYRTASETGRGDAAAANADRPWTGGDDARGRDADGR